MIARTKLLNFQKPISSLVTHYYLFGNPTADFFSYLFSSRKGQIYPHFRFSYLFFRPKCRSRFMLLKYLLRRFTHNLAALLGMKQLFYFRGCLTRIYVDPPQI